MKLNKDALRPYAAFFYRYGLPPLTMAVVAWILTMPIFQFKSWYWSHDMARFPYLASLFRESFEHGFWFPRWLPELMGGYGYPTFLFYQPGFFFLSLPFTALIDNVVLALKVELFALIVLGGLGAYLLAGEFVASRLLRLGCAVLFMFTPYISINMGTRSALTEMFAQLVIPTSIFALLRLHRAVTTRASNPWPWIAAFAASVAAVIYGHPFVTMFYMPFIGLLGLGCWAATPRDFRFPLIFALCILLGMTLAAPVIVTVFTMKQYVTIENFQWLFPPAQNMKTFIGFYFNPGAMHLTLAVLGFVLAGLRRPVVFASAVAYAAMLFLMSDYSDFLWQMDLPIRYAQFPWRINSVACSAQYLGILYAVQYAYAHWFAPRNKRLAVGVLLLVLAVATAYTLLRPQALLNGKWDKWRRGAFTVWGPLSYKSERDNYRTTRFSHMSVGNGDFTPHGADIKGLYNRNRFNVPIVEVFNERAGRIDFEGDHSDYRLHFTFRFGKNGPVHVYHRREGGPPSVSSVNNGPQEHSSILINQFYLPGWKILVDGKPAAFTDSPVDTQDTLSWGPGKNGRIRVNFPEPGSYDVKAWYDGPPNWRTRNALMLAIGAAIVGAMRFLLRRKA